MSPFLIGYMKNKELLLSKGMELVEELGKELVEKNEPFLIHQIESTKFKQYFIFLSYCLVT